MPAQQQEKPQYQYQQEGRQRKAEAIAALLVDLKATPEQAAALSPEARKMAAQLAKQREPSKETWTLVVQMIRVAQRRPRR